MAAVGFPLRSMTSSATGKWLTKLSMIPCCWVGVSPIRLLFISKITVAFRLPYVFLVANHCCSSYFMHWGRTFAHLVASLTHRLWEIVLRRLYIQLQLNSSRSCVWSTWGHQPQGLTFNFWETSKDWSNGCHCLGVSWTSLSDNLKGGSPCQTVCFVSLLYLQNVLLKKMLGKQKTKGT